MIAIVGIHYRNSAHCNICRSCLLILFLFPDDFERNTNISVAIKSGFTVLDMGWVIIFLKGPHTKTDLCWRAKPTIT